MNLLITIGHPAHFHYFKNTAKILIKKGNDVLFFVRDKDCILELFKQEKFDYVCYGKGGESLLSKVFNLPIVDYRLYKVAKTFKSDCFLSFSSPYAAHVSSLLKKPHVAFDDTEHNLSGHLLYRPFTDVIFSPYVYSAKLHKNQILLKLVMEYIYLNKKYFNPNTSVLDNLGISKNEKYCILRFVAWNATHDVGVESLDDNDKLELIEHLSTQMKVFISSEGELPKELESYKLNINPIDFHSVLSKASLCISEGTTTASEAAVLGVPTILSNPLRVGYCDEEERVGLLHKAFDKESIIAKIKDLAQIDEIKEKYQEKRNNLMSEMIDGTAFLTWFIESYPESKRIMKENPDYQYKFK